MEKGQLGNGADGLSEGQQQQVHPAPTTLIAPSPPGYASVILAWASLVLGLIFMCGGLYETFTYDSSSHLVGADAYNFQILATRGAVLVGCGIGCIVASTFHAVLALRAAVLTRG